MIAVLALGISVVTFLFGLVLLQRERDRNISNADIDERVKRLESMLDECEKHRSELIERNAHLENEALLRGYDS